MVGLTQTLFDLIRQYGFLALFVYMVLETGLILHFAPSELVVPFAARILVTGAVTFWLFVLIATLGSTLGALFVYVIFNRYGLTVIDRYGRYINIDRDELDRSQEWFQRWGESSVLWGRVLPVLRAAISIPAGLAEMNIRKFTAYSAIGSFLFNITITYLTAGGGNAKSPLDLLVEWVVANSSTAAYISANRLRVGFQLVIVLAVVAFIWTRRDWIRANPEAAKTVAVRVIFWVGIIGGLLLISIGVYIPHDGFPVITWVWNDPEYVVSHYGISQQMALIVSGIIVALVAAGISALGRHFSFERLGLTR